MTVIRINGNDLTLDEIVMVARQGYKVELTKEAEERVIKSRNIVDEIVDNNRVIYGITTGFGKFSDVTISGEDCKKLQRNLIISHACGAGKAFSNEIVKTIMLLRANALAKGYSGIRLSTLKTLIQMINSDVNPIIPEKGSLGASGDLAPLSHMVLTMLGEGEAEYNGEILPGKVAMEKAGIEIIELTAKEGLALINGTQVMTAVGALAVYDSINLLKTCDIAAALSLEALRGVKDAFDARTHSIRPHKGQIQTAKNILNLNEYASCTLISP